MQMFRKSIGIIIQLLRKSINLHLRNIVFCYFGELSIYYSDVNGLIYDTMWRNVEKVYGKMKEKELINKVIGVLSQQVKDYATWASESENQEWDFSKFFEFPFIKDGKGNYILLSER